jgi:aldehyde dehydrogenase (NAD+)
MKEKPQLTFGTAWDYSPAPESASNVSIQKEYGLYINGKWVKAEGGKTFASENPATGEHIALFAEASDKDVDKAVKAARKAYTDVWSKLPAKERAKYIFRIARLIQERSREFAICESMDGGKPIRESRDIDVPLAANHFFYYAGWADKLEYAFPARKCNRLAWQDRSSRGTSRC